ncbi:unnamed protein product, partial [Soboliphyme baturini]|uniref:EB1 C-terminal domain-containing protein n=1 Tax=Soboliphyme baturini TaxID=241478 RepID=A0A183J881_9BILA
SEVGASLTCTVVEKPSAKAITYTKEDDEETPRLHVPPVKAYDIERTITRDTVEAERKRLIAFYEEQYRIDRLRIEEEIRREVFKEFQQVMSMRTARQIKMTENLVLDTQIYADDRIEALLNSAKGDINLADDSSVCSVESNAGDVTVVQRGQDDDEEVLTFVCKQVVEIVEFFDVS